VLYQGKDISTYSEVELNEFRNQKIGFVFQKHHLLPQCSLLENILLPTIPLKETSLKKEAYARAEGLLKYLGLWELRNQKPGLLSGGECQRGAVIRALINEPLLILADEPTGALDKENAEMLADLLIEITKKEKRSLIMVTHSEKIALKADKCFSLDDGKLKELNK